MKADTDYYVAVVAVDEAGNRALLTGGPFRTEKETTSSTSSTATTVITSTTESTQTTVTTESSKTTETNRTTAPTTTSRPTTEKTTASSAATTEPTGEVPGSTTANQSGDVQTGVDSVWPLALAVAGLAVLTGIAAYGGSRKRKEDIR